MRHPLRLPAFLTTALVVAALAQAPTFKGGYFKATDGASQIGVEFDTSGVINVYVDNQASGARFVVYLRQLKGLKQKDMSNHTAWEPGATHFGIAVPNAQALWGQLQASGHLRARSWGGARACGRRALPGRRAAG